MITATPVTDTALTSSPTDAPVELPPPPPPIDRTPDADTIFSLSSAPGRAGVSVIRVSGPRARTALEDLTARPPPPPRELRLRTLLDPHDGEPLDQALVVWLPAPHSFTGEDTVELFVHGGVAVVRDTLTALSRLPTLRSAEPGEFTRRAFENDRLDLTAIEGLSDLIRAETTHQRQHALRHANGDLERLLSEWRQLIVDSMARMEACIDFAEEVEASASSSVAGEEAGEVSHWLVDSVRRDLSTLAGSIQRVIRDSRNCGERIRDGVRIVLTGPPNAGKSSLLNRISKRKAALVSVHPGTTRDALEVHLDLAGYPAVLCDTAGIRDTDDEIESAGVALAIEQVVNADVQLFLFDLATRLDSSENRVALDLLLAQLTAKSMVSAPLVDSLAQASGLTDTPEHHPRQLVLLNKSDKFADACGANEALSHFESRLLGLGTPPLLISCENGDGLEDLSERLTEQVREFFARGVSRGHGLQVTRVRHRQLLELCVEHLLSVLETDDLILATEELRRASHAIGQLTGRVDVEEVLDVVFQEFCIGK
eukprot:CAMPEP_0174234732 /NCGR_PEP_ID=MMETSP0417-20130205/4408_1 /TAXON_ID=242541 /ORGANISM="Mayorella sp, Strain BSH-02190019" /LENGTH=540 /DNA_ID=CAMNT_0015313139 /DNA_START=66 /DNA_END=1688 /DNA_ORIENTATION=-